MRARFLAHSYPRYPADPVGSFVLRLAVALRGQGVEVDVVAPGGAGLAARETYEQVPVRRYRYAPRAWETVAYTGTMSAQAGASWRARGAVTGLVVANAVAAWRAGPRPDVVHAHWWFPGGLAGGWVASLWRRPLVITLHGSDVRTFEGFPFGRRIFRHVLRRADRVTTVSTGLADAVRDVVPEIAPLVIPMPVAPDLFHPADRRSSEPRVLFVGKLNAQKGIEPFLHAFARVRAPATADIVAGVGSDDAPWRARAAELGIAERLRWHPLLEQAALARLLRESTVLAMPAVQEGLGLVAIEAQLSGTPVVAFASGGLCDIVADGDTGHLVPPGDAEALAAALDRVLMLPDRGRTLGEAGRRRALERFAPEAVARRYAELYRQVQRPADRA
jgi:glycosyltransferase involved in cell wall biosynthesis